MPPLSPERRRQVTESRMAFWQVLREAMAADLAPPAEAQPDVERVAPPRAA